MNSIKEKIIKFFNQNIKLNSSEANLNQITNPYDIILLEKAY